jgi:succinate dehydrogenase hydrophobic anchor subunit
MFFLGTLVDQNVALYYNKAPTTHHLANFGIGIIVALLLFSRFICSFLTMELNQFHERLLDPASQEALHILEMAHTHAQTLGSAEYSEESTADRGPGQKYWTMMRFLGLALLVLAIFFFIAILISLVLPLHPRLDEMANTIHPETFLFLLIVFAVLSILIIDRGLKNTFSDSIRSPEATKRDTRQIEFSKEEE